MPRENVEIVRRGIEAWDRRDLTVTLAPWSSDAEIDRSRATGSFKGGLARSAQTEAFRTAFGMVLCWAERLGAAA